MDGTEERGSLSAIVLASGDTARMRSLRPKPLYVLCGRPLLFYVLDSLATCGVQRAAVVLGIGSEKVAKRVHEYDAPFGVDIVERPTPQGTGDAVSAGLTAFSFDDFDDDDDLLVLPGDMPLLRASTVEDLLDRHRSSGAAATLLTVSAPAGSAGMVVRGRDNRIVSASGNLDAGQHGTNRRSSRETLAVSDEQLTLVSCFRKSLLAPALRRIEPVAGDFFLADVVGVLADAGHRVESLPLADRSQAMTVDDREQMADVEAELRARTNRHWLRSGVTLVDPAATYIDTTVKLGADVTIFPNTYLHGRTVVGNGAELGPETRLTDCMVGTGARVEKTIGQDAEVGPEASVGPFAVLESGAQVPPGGRVAPFTVATSTEPTTDR